MGFSAVPAVVSRALAGENVAAAVLAIVPMASRYRQRPRGFGFSEKYPPPILAPGADAASADMHACVVYVFLVTWAGSEYSVSTCVPVMNEIGPASYVREIWMPAAAPDPPTTWNVLPDPTLT